VRTSVCGQLDGEPADATRGAGDQYPPARNRSGGPHLVAAWQLLAPGGSLQSVGWASGEPAVFPPYSTIGPPKSLTSFVIEGHVDADLAALLHLVASGSLAVEIGWRGPWEDVTGAAEALRGRRVDGKAVLDVTPAAR